MKARQSEKVKRLFGNEESGRELVRTIQKASQENSHFNTTVKTSKGTSVRVREL